jgi:predicted AAA+ superfamily ATPase
LSVNALRGDLGLAHNTVERWVGAFGRLCAPFRLPPSGAPRLRAVCKARKHHHFDWTVVDADGPRFENLVACTLLKWVQFEQDARGRDFELRYFRDVDGREVDFVVVERRRPVLLVECKWSDEEPHRVLRYLDERFPACLALQLSAAGTKDCRTPTGLRVAPALALLRDLV